MLSPSHCCVMLLLRRLQLPERRAAMITMTMR
jgi:hypothetical protein